MAGPWQKSPPELAEAFDRALGGFPQAERRKMFGYPCAFANGQMVTGLHEQNWIVRLPAVERERLMAEGGKPFAPMGRAMKEYVVLPVEIRKSSAALHKWLEKSFTYAQSLPPKSPRSAAKPSSKPAAVQRSAKSRGTK